MPVGVVRRCDSEEKSANFASIFFGFLLHLKRCFCIFVAELATIWGDYRRNVTKMHYVYSRKR